MAERPGLVPIDQIHDYTDVISVVDLGLPVGFDSSNLLLDVDRTERLSRLAGIGHLLIRGFQGETTQDTFRVTGINPDGSGVAAKTTLMRRASIVNTSNLEIDEDGLPQSYRWAHGEVNINNAEIRSRILGDGDNWELGEFDPFARAKYMDRALRLGITAIGREEVFRGDVPGTLLESAFLQLVRPGLIATVTGASLPKAIVYDIFWAAIFNQVSERMYKLRKGYDDNLRHKSSLVSRRTYDRLALAHGYAALNRLISVRKPE